MRRPSLLVCLTGALTVSLCGCFRRVEVFEPTPCFPSPPSGKSALAWSQTKEGAGTVYGRVVELYNLAPVTHASVSLSDVPPGREPSPVSPTGAFSLPVRDSGQYVVVVRAIGFEAVQATVDLRGGLGTQVLATLSPSMATFDGCGNLMTVRRWRFWFP